MLKNKASFKSPENITKQTAVVEDRSLEAMTETIIESGLNFYRKGLYISLALIGICLFIILLLAFKPLPTQEIRGTAPDGSIHKLIVLDEPNHSQSTLIDFSSRCMRKALSMNFANYEKKDKKNATCFTDAGKKAFEQVRNKSNWFRLMLSNQQSIKTITNGVGMVAGDLKNASGWVIELPMIMRADQLARQPVDTKLFIKLVLLPVKDNKHAAGLAIHEVLIQDVR